MIVLIVKHVLRNIGTGYIYLICKAGFLEEGRISRRRMDYSDTIQCGRTC